MEDLRFIVIGNSCLSPQHHWGGTTGVGLYFALFLWAFISFLFCDSMLVFVHREIPVISTLDLHLCKP